MNVLQLIIAIPLFTFMGFGISFILNMILKTTWVPLVLYAGLLVYFFITKGVLLGGDYLMLTVGLLGVLSGGWVINYLRVNGYRMF